MSHFHGSIHSYSRTGQSNGNKASGLPCNSMVCFFTVLLWFMFPPCPTIGITGSRIYRRQLDCLVMRLGEIAKSICSRHFHTFAVVQPCLPRCFLRSARFFHL